MDSLARPSRRRVAAVLAAAVLAAAAFAAMSAPAPAAVNNLTQSANPVTGYADLHAHQFANLGFGGLLLWGEPFHENGIDWALPWSDFMPCGRGRGRGAERYAGRPDHVGQGIFSSATRVPAACPPGTGEGSDPPAPAWRSTATGGLGDLLNFALSGSIGHCVGGYPQFDGWPRWNNYTGQQMYCDWLEAARTRRAAADGDAGRQQRGAVRAVNRPRGFGCGDMPRRSTARSRPPRTSRATWTAATAAPGQGWFASRRSAPGARDHRRAASWRWSSASRTPSLFGCNEQVELHAAVRRRPSSTTTTTSASATSSRSTTPTTGSAGRRSTTTSSPSTTRSSPATGGTSGTAPRGGIDVPPRRAWTHQRLGSRLRRRFGRVDPIPATGRPLARTATPAG